MQKEIVVTCNPVVVVGSESQSAKSVKEISQTENQAENLLKYLENKWNEKKQVNSS